MALSLGPGHAAALDALQPSPYWGTERIWDTRVNNHNSMFGRDGRLWLAASVRAPDNPAFCKQGSDHPSARAFPMDRAIRHLAVFDLKTQKYSFVDTCFSTHHLQFGYDNNDTIWTSGGGPVVGWLNSKMFTETGDAAKSQGWTALVLDTNGNGKRDAYIEPGEPADPTKDTRINAAFYAVMPSPVDGSVWGAVLGVPGAVVRLAPGAHPPGRRSPRFTTCPCQDSARAVPTSTARVSYGFPSAVATWAASIAANASPAERTEGHWRPLSRGVGRSISIPARASRALARTARSRAITRGSTSTTRSASATTCRCRPVISTTGSSPSPTDAWSSCACPIRWASMRRVRRPHRRSEGWMEGPGAVGL